MLLVRAPSGGTIDALAEVEPVQVIRNAIRGNQSTEMVTVYRGKRIHSTLSFALL